MAERNTDIPRVALDYLMDLLITEVTNMSVGHFCVAAWRPQSGRMVRPLPAGAHWTAPLLQRGDVKPGQWIRTGPQSANATGLYPHRTEDTPIDVSGIIPLERPPIDWLGNDAPPSHATLNGAFEGQVHDTGRWNGAVKARTSSREPRLVRFRL